MSNLPFNPIETRYTIVAVYEKHQTVLANFLFACDAVAAFRSMCAWGKNYIAIGDVVIYPQGVPDSVVVEALVEARNLQRDNS